jgi:hypothetical protein
MSAAATADLLPIEALTPDGLLVRSDGVLVRYLEVVPINPLALSAHDCERHTCGLTDLMGLVPAGTWLQLHVHATPIALDELLDRQRNEVTRATQPLPAPTRAALQRLGDAHAASVRLHADAQAALGVRYILVAPFAAPDTPTSRRTRAVHDRLARESLNRAQRLRSALTGLDMKAANLRAPPSPRCYDSASRRPRRRLPTTRSTLSCCRSTRRHAIPPWPPRDSAARSPTCPSTRRNAVTSSSTAPSNR